MLAASSLTLSPYREVLEAVVADLFSFSKICRTSLERAIGGLVQRDEDLLARVIADDEDIGTHLCRLDQDGVEVLAKYHPLACDLRRVVASMKINLALRAVAAQSVGIARKALDLSPNAALPEMHFIENNYEHVAAMLQDSVASFMNEDLSLARTMRARDRALDEMNAFTGDRLVGRMGEHPGNLRDYVNLIFVSRHLERAGDLAANIAEDAVYAIAAEDIRHLPSPKSVPMTPAG